MVAEPDNPGQAATGTLPAVVVTLSAAAWGLYWIPLRALTGAGVPVGWAVAAFFVVPVALISPLAAWRHRWLLAGGARLVATGLLGGAAMAAYSLAITLTAVVHALLLFYLTPVWSTLLERWMLGTAVHRTRLASLALGFAGLAVLLAPGAAVAHTAGLGDGLALLAGVLWALAAVRIRADRVNGPIELALASFAGGALVAVGYALLAAAPLAIDHAALATALPWFAAFVLLVVIPSMITIMWGAARLSPGLVGVLFMTEISVGTLTAAAWAGEPFGARELGGVALVSLAGLVEIIWRRLGRVDAGRG